MNDAFSAYCKAAGLPEPEPEFAFAKSIGRKWKFDWAWPNQMIALELEGGAFRGPGHRSVRNFLNDMEKYNTAAIMGWRLVRCTTDMMKNGEVLTLLEKILKVQ